MPLPIRKLISLPPAAARHFDRAYPRLASEWFATSDPPGARLGSGGGLAHLLVEGFRRTAPGQPPTLANLEGWLSEGHTLAVLAGGHSRRLPAFAATGKALVPIPPIRGQQGVRTDQVLLDLLESPILDAIGRTGDPRVVIATGDVILTPEDPLPPLTGADAVFVGADASHDVLSRFGVFVVEDGSLKGFLQKPPHTALASIPADGRALLDVGLWSLSLEAALILLDRSATMGGEPFELYREFGADLVQRKLIAPDGRPLSSAVLDWPAGFHHLGSTLEFLEMLSVLTGEPVLGWANEGPVGEPTVVTGIATAPTDKALPSQTGLDVTPLEGGRWAVRPYGFSDTFSGPVAEATLISSSALNWFVRHRLEPPPGEDIQFAKAFPVFDSKPGFNEVRALFEEGCEPMRAEPVRWISAFEIANEADVTALVGEQRELKSARLMSEADKREASLLQYDLAELAEILDAYRADPSLTGLQAIHSFMLEAAVHRSEQAERQAFATLRALILSDPRLTRCDPVWAHTDDAQVVARAPARWDLAGGWSDTPPYPLVFGGEVVNVAVDVNGAPPIQAFLRRSAKPGIQLTSVDLSQTVQLGSEDDLTSYGDAADPFGIAKAALALAGFERRFRGALASPWGAPASEGGFALTLSSSLPKGSGLGTSSILGSAVLAALSTGFGLGWSPEDLALRTLALEQLLTSGGGWQDQIGGLYPGIKVAISRPGEAQDIRVFGLPETLLTEPSFAGRVLLYNTGITRVAKSVLGEIVRGLFLNSRTHIDTVTRIKENARVCASAVEECDSEGFCASIRESWALNCLLDSGTCPPEVASIERRFAPCADAYKLLGAGGGGFFMIVAKSAKDAERIRLDLEANPPNPQGRFFEWSVSQTGLTVAVY